MSAKPGLLLYCLHIKYKDIYKPPHQSLWPLLHVNRICIDMAANAELLQSAGDWRITLLIEALAQPPSITVCTKTPIQMWQDALYHCPMPESLL